VLEGDPSVRFALSGW